MHHSPWTDHDRQQLSERGISLDQAEWQLQTLKTPPDRVQLVRACSLGDGIVALDESKHQHLLECHQRSLSRWQKFVPASGAASRMFTLSSDDDKQRLCSELDCLALSDELRAVCRQREIDLDAILHDQRADELIDLVAGDRGLHYAEQPKGLIPFHQYDDGVRTPFEEHLLEAAECFGNDGFCRVHFTVSTPHRAKFEQQLEEIQRRHPHLRWDVSFSAQHPATDTLALRPDVLPLREPDGALVFRPGGHGALLQNLGQLNADLLFLKNIDNVRHEQLQSVSRLWIKLISGYTAWLDEQLRRCLQALQTNESDAPADARALVAEIWPELAVADLSAEDLIHMLQRPLRVCGMVRNEGEPGGGPFWVRTPDGNLTLQIIEGAEVDATTAQQEIYRQGTHFNPVFMAAAVLDPTQQPWELQKFIDQQRVIITEKHAQGVMARVLERPGLWNGSMAWWNTVFVEVPAQVFSPVKSVMDLLRAEHQRPSA